MTSGAVSAIHLPAAWDVPHAAIGVAGRSGIVNIGGELLLHGDPDHRFRIASVAKLFVAYVMLIAHEEGSISLDEAAGPEGATIRHLLAHTAGYSFDGETPIAAVGQRRIYSNTGIEVAARHLEQRTGMPYGDYLRDAVLEPLAMTNTSLKGSPAWGIHSTVSDLARFVGELLAPTLVAAGTLRDATSVQFPGLRGIIPGVGRFIPCDWGLGFERNFGRAGHWSGTSFGTSAFGHFGGSGTFVVVDPDLDCGVICLTDRQFGDWALAAWPPFCDALVSELRNAPGGHAA